MDLNKYVRPLSGNRRGIHWSPSVFHPTGSTLTWWIDELHAMHISWVKLLDDGSGSSRHVCVKLLEAGLLPIVRLYRLQPNPGVLGERELRTISDLVQLGVRYFESNNEPNLPDEWSPGEWQSGGRPELVAQNWLQDAEAILARGGYPAFPALAQASHHPDHGSIPWYCKSFRWLADNAYERAQSVFDGGAWIAVHDAVLNHCYRDEEDSWHFEYPYDPICQADQPGKTIMDDDNSLLGHRVPVQLLEELFSVQVPVISTEGGMPVPRGGWQQWDTRYPGYDLNGHAERSVAMFEWLQANGEQYYFAMCPWLIASERMGHVDPVWRDSAWYRLDQELPVVNAVKAMDPEPTSVPPGTLLDDSIRSASWNKRGIAFNPEAIFARFAREQRLGSPVTNEFDLTWDTKAYRIQGFTGGIVYAEVGDWGNVQCLPW